MPGVSRGRSVLRTAKLLMLAAFCWLVMMPAASRAQQAMRVEQVTVTTAKGTFEFQTEIADTEYSAGRNRA